MSQYQAAANSLIEHYDFNDIRKGMAFAKSQVEVKETTEFNEAMAVVNELFAELIKWLEQHGKEL